MCPVQQSQFQSRPHNSQPIQAWCICLSPKKLVLLTQVPFGAPLHMCCPQVLMEPPEATMAVLEACGPAEDAVNHTPASVLPQVSSMFLGLGARNSMSACRGGDPHCIECEPGVGCSLCMITSRQACRFRSGRPHLGAAVGALLCSFHAPAMLITAGGRQQHHDIASWCYPPHTAASGHGR
jgi:hypothetical protein